MQVIQAEAAIGVLLDDDTGIGEWRDRPDPIQYLLHQTLQKQPAMRKRTST